MKKRTKRRTRIIKKKPCFFCQEKQEPDWQNFEQLEQFLSPRSRILSRLYGGLCVKHQKAASREIKRARHLGLLPFVTIIEK